MDDFEHGARGASGATAKQDSPQAPDVGGISVGHLKSFIERIERLEEEKKALAEDIKDVYAEAKGTGFDTKIIRKVISLRKRDQADIEEEETILDLYLRALGMLPNIDDE
jgi:uncharacterized protein (UPF0335 family)